MGILLMWGGQRAPAQTVTSWIAFHDHRPGDLTDPNATGFDIRLTGNGGFLKDFATGAQLPVEVVVTSTGTSAPDDFGATAYPDFGSPASDYFDGKVDIGNPGTIGLRNSAGSTVLLTFKNLDPSKKYSFVGTSVRGGNYVNRWAAFTLAGAAASTPAHQVTTDPPNLITKATYPASTLGPDQVALSSGHNLEGSLVSWEGIDPGEDGEFSILQEQYVGPHPLGPNNDGPYGYAITAFSLKEVSETLAINITSSPANVNATPGQNVSFSVTTNGTGASYQWQKAEAGATVFSDIPGANAGTYAAGAVSLGQDGQRYRVIVTGQGLTLTSRAATLTVRGALVEIPGLLKLELYKDIPGTAVDDLLNSPKYPAAPDEVTAISAFNTRTALPTDALENYGAVISGFITPRVTGNYDFMLRSDDASQFLISTDSTEENLQLIAEETACCQGFEEPGVSARTTIEPIPLVAGNKYAVRAFLKEGGGGDYLQVAWRLVGDTAPAGTLTPVPAAFLSSMFQERGIVNITQQLPATLSAPRNGLINLSVAATSAVTPLLVQWQKNGVTIPGVTGSSIVLGPLAATDNDAVFRAVLSTPGGTLTSTPMTLTVTTDVIPPTVAAVTASPTFNTLTVDFSEAVTSASAGALANYTLTGGISILGVQVISPTRVLITTGTQAPGTNYVLSISNIVDSAGVVSTANSNATFSSFAVLKGGLRFEAWNGIGGVAINDLLSSANFEGPPDFSGYITAADTRLIYPDDTHENYGARLSGWLVPTETASYDFMLRSDDAGQLSLSADDTPEGLEIIASESACCGGFEEPGGERTTAVPIDLVANKRYFFEVLYKEGGGGDYAQVAWRKTTDTTPAGILAPIPGAFFEIIAPPGTLTPPTADITAPLPGAVVPVNTDFQVTVEATPAPGKTVSRVEIFRGSTKIADLTSGPYGVLVTGLPSDVYLFSTRVTDSTGLTYTTSPFSVPVGEAREIRNIFQMDELTMWRYDRSGEDLGTDWREKNYIDSAWPAGAALIGEEPTAFTIPLRTPVSRLTDDGAYIKTMYFRTKFNWSGATADAKLSLRHVIDDGAVFYLNGTEVHRFGITAGVVVDATTDAASHEQFIEGPFAISGATLVEGENVLAVEVHQSGASSSDIVFGAELTASVPSSGVSGPPEITRIQVTGPTLRLEWRNGLLQTRSQLETGPWFNVPGATSPYTTPATQSKRFFRVAQ